ncbi:hypothetical protein RND81_09G047200 [Saponaria officinalis]|uniref:HTH myb-type domain-containing protein n=1 Tax=Saponaria officinalis TaxID=3572 RepID=A0AAW1IIT4_SAPOF
MLKFVNKIADKHVRSNNFYALIIWREIHSCTKLPGRTDNEIKNYWNTRVKRRLRQGLPLYPNQNNSVSTQTAKTQSFQQPPSFPLSLHKNTPNNNHNNLSLFNPISLPSSFFPLHHPPPFLAPHFQRRDLNTFTGHLVSSPSQMGSFQLNSNGFGSGYGFDSGQVPMTRFGSEGFNFDTPRNFELPSNQYDQNETYDHEVVSEVKDNNDPNVGRTKSGLLDDLLQEAQIKATGRGVKREREDCGLQWDVSTSENSFTGIKKEEFEGQQLNSEKEDISNLLDLIPSLVHVPEWCNDGGGGDSPVDQSASITSIEINNDDDKTVQPPLPTVMSTSDYEDNGDDWNNNDNSYSWDNLPRIY